jgi:hypothetical protein
MDSHVSSPRRLATVKETVKSYPRAFKSEASLRWALFSNPEFRGAVARKLGARLLLDLDAFEAWLDRQGAAS